LTRGVERSFEMTKKRETKSKAKGVKKLKLRRETLKDLDSKAVRSVKGGAVNRAGGTWLKNC